MRLLVVAAFSAAVLAVPSSQGLCDVATFGATKDNTLYSSTTGARSNGAGDYFFTGVTAQGGIRRGLLAFDVSAIPADATVNSATLTLHMSRTATFAQDVGLHRVLADWGEGASNANNEEGRGAPSEPGDATWLHTFYNTSLWTTQGGDFDPIASAVTSVEFYDFYSWSSPAMTADVQSWVDGTAGSFGWLVMSNESIQLTAKRFDSRENPAPEFRPLLVVDYTPVPEPAGVCVIVAGAWVRLISRTRAFTSARP